MFLQKFKPVLRKFRQMGRKYCKVREGAGIVDIGDDLAVVFKAESHNHPSAVEPMKEQQLVLVESSATSSVWEQDRLLF